MSYGTKFSGGTLICTCIVHPIIYCDNNLVGFKNINPVPVSN